MAGPTGISLKGYSTFLSEYLGLTPLAVYERQRALVRLGLLPEAGRGPNSGVRATPVTTTPLLVTALVTDNLSEVDERVKRLLNAKPSETERRLERYREDTANADSAERQWKALGRAVPVKRPLRPDSVQCSITGASTFKAAISSVLGSRELASQVREITVNRTELTGTILATDERVSEFGKPKLSRRPVLNVWSRLPGEVVLRIASDLAALSEITERTS